MTFPAAPDAPGALRAIWQRRRDEVLARVDVVDEAIAAMLREVLGDDLRASAHRAAHKLTGAAGTFGFPRASELARELELAFDPACMLRRADAPRLAGLAVGLRAELEDEPGGTLSTTAPGQNDCVVIVSEDEALARRLADEALGRGLRAHVTTDVAAAASTAAAQRSDVVLLDLHLPRQGIAALTLLEQLAQVEAAAPVVCLTATESFVDRIEVARRGGRGYLPRSLPAGNVLDVVDQILRRRRASATRVLVVDDDAALLSAVEELLSSHGVEATTLADPLLLWDALEALDPDLVVLDVDMPEVGGIELCRVIRNEPRWSGLPILFLTARTDPESVHELFAAGADDYVPKPIVGPELLTRVTNRVERVALYRSLSDIDALTGVATRRAATEALERLLALSRRGQPLALGVIDLDNFKQVNDEHGHPVGDRVLQRVGALLQATFRGEDVVARWGGEEFVVGLYASNKEDAARRLERTLDVLRGERFTAADGRRFTVSFSAGVAEHPADADDLQELFAAADTALYQAKDAGRDRILVAGPRVRPSGLPVDVVIVEDDAALSGLLAETLETAGLSVHAIADGQAAVDALSGPEPTLRARVTLLDVDLPGVDGLTVLRRLAADRVLRGTRVIMLTARSAETEVVTALQLGAFDHVAKPFSLPVLMQRVQRALESMP